MNGGLGFKDKEKRFYYMFGIRYNLDKKKFTYNRLYLVECLFHEFSHSIVNPLVNKYFDLFQIDELYEYSVQNRLFACYQTKNSFLYEYIVRTNALLLAQKYFKDAEFNSDIVEGGFTFLDNVLEFTKDNYIGYPNYEVFFREKLIEFFNQLMERNQIESL